MHSPIRGGLLTANALPGRPEPLERGIAMQATTHQTYAELLQQMHEALRAQNPQWIEPDGESPICDDYERRLAELLELVTNE
jgi:hypothetical protein